MSEEKRSEAAPTIDLFRGWELAHNPRNKEIGEIKKRIRGICERQKKQETRNEKREGAPRGKGHKNAPTSGGTGSEKPETRNRREEKGLRIEETRNEKQETRNKIDDYAYKTGTTTSL